MLSLSLPVLHRPSSHVLLLLLSLFLCDLPDFERVRRVPVTGKATVIRGLVVGTRYRVALQAINVCGRGPIGAAITVR